MVASRVPSVLGFNASSFTPISGNRAKRSFSPGTLPKLPPDKKYNSCLISKDFGELIDAFQIHPASGATKAA